MIKVFFGLAIVIASFTISIWLGLFVLVFAYLILGAMTLLSIMNLPPLFDPPTGQEMKIIFFLWPKYVNGGWHPKRNHD